VGIQSGSQKLARGEVIRVSLDANFELIDTGLGKTKSEKTLFCQELKKTQKVLAFRKFFYIMRVLAASVPMREIQT
jgi:hypothetical protein